MTKQECSSLISKEEITSLFSQSYFYENHSFHFIEKDTLTYNESRDKNNFLLESELIYEKYKTGHTIIVKNFESFNKAIINKCRKLGSDVDVHLYINPPNGSPSFDFHTDDRDVLIHQVYGNKTFELKKDKVLKFELEANDELSIPKGTLHKATAYGASCLLSFGIHSNINYLIPTNFKLEDFSG